jgi:hypothetical protein
METFWRRFDPKLFSIRAGFGRRDYIMASSPPKKDPENSHSYMVRMWRDGPEEPWRASVKSVASDREMHFPSPEKLFLFLYGQLVEPIDPGAALLDDAGAGPFEPA